MTGQELLDHIRNDVLRDSALPYLWSDDLILLMLSEAESLFARYTYALLDSSQTISTSIGTSTYDVPVGTLKIVSAAIDGRANDLIDYTRRFIPTNLATATGTPTIFTNDEAAGVIRLYPVPDAELTVNLRIARLPTAAVTLSTAPEIPAEYHMDLVEYVAWKLLGSNDADGESVRGSERHGAEWKSRLALAKREYFRARTHMNPNVARSYTFQRNC